MGEPLHERERCLKELSREPLREPLSRSAAELREARTMSGSSAGRNASGASQMTQTALTHAQRYEATP